VEGAAAPCAVSNNVADLPASEESATPKAAIVVVPLGPIFIQDLPVEAQQPSVSQALMPAVCAPATPAAFLQLMTKELLTTSLITPPRRRQRSRVIPVAPLRGSVRLTKKAANRLVAVMAAQNLLMHKLGIASGSSIESQEFDY
jgi:hypothetical protein